MPFNKLVGIRVVRQHSDGVTIACPMTERLRNSAGVMHGGVFTTVADAAVGIGLASHFGGRRPVTTTEMKINFLEAVVVLLTLTNAASVVAAAYALSIAHGVTRPRSKSQETPSPLRFLLRALRVDHQQPDERRQA